MKKAVNRLRTHVGRALDAIVETLQNDEDLDQLCLTAQRQRQGQEQLQPLSADFHKDAELVLEEYCRILLGLQSEIDELTRDMEDTQGILQIQIDRTRNRLIKLNINVAITTLSLTAGMAIAGVMGMNLTSGWEEHPMAFYWVTLGCGGIAGMSFLAYFIFYRRVLRSIAAHECGDIRTLQSFLTQLDSIQRTLRHRMAKGELATREELVDFLEDADSTSPLTRAEANSVVDLCFSVFDKDNSGTISWDELLVFIDTSRASNPVWHPSQPDGDVGQLPTTDTDPTTTDTKTTDTTTDTTKS